MPHMEYTLLPDPAPRQRGYTVISVDDHVTEPPDTFTGRVPARFADRAPMIVDVPQGGQAWVYENSLHFEWGMGSSVGRPQSEWFMEPIRYDEIRGGCWNVHDRVRDMDIDGVAASLCFPSVSWGFAGRVFSMSRDQELGLACLRAYNDWHLEAWAGLYPERFIPLQLPWLSDVAIATEEVHRNAARGFKAVSFPDAPYLLGYPPITSAAWDPFFRACEETETVLCLHVGASGRVVQGSPGSWWTVSASLFPVQAYVAAIDWVWAGIPVRYPGLKIALSEGGIGWVPMALDRLDYVMEHSANAGGRVKWTGDVTPREALQRNFYFCMLDDPSTLHARHRIGVDHIMVESDYPHGDSVWPNTQTLLEQRLAGIPADEADRITHGNAAKLFRHPVPESFRAEPALADA